MSPVAAYPMTGAASPRVRLPPPESPEEKLLIRRPPLYDPRDDHASCGLGFVARADGAASHEIVEYGLQILANLAHRGATGSDAGTGDGAGILLQIPDAFFRRRSRELPFELPPEGGYGVGMVFLCPD